ncbi:Gfo/Idh/MocA family oxidoreductase [Geobacter pelophilus]|uniref:Gfo/Idh/MocA family oxidoreductase n=1 Tax=Geoanaerobacter pelophilus TaxID=60036 RepID=A0AAW4L204_9BACT|nr:Gfo/Idh/MocA family oxidoreductase [Geoanaerobacter pelophilus]MBT0663008.1 Gfo/Idh/MocA family oxidoreductase [Geoanaerobacter pelophilus]
MKFAVVGLGYWGPNLVRNFQAHPQITSVIACDEREQRLEFARSRFPGISTCNSIDALIQDPDLKAVAIATPVNTHYDLAKKILEAGKHVWVEKPFTASSNHARHLIEIAKQNNRVIFVDHTFLYTGAVRKIKEVLDKGELGDVLYFDSVRINLGLFQHDVNVMWDLAPHDLSIMSYLVGKKPYAVSANGIANFNGMENVAHLSVYFEGNCFAHFHVNWTSPVKIRRMIMGGTKKMMVFDDMENFDKVKIYDTGVAINTEEGVHQALVEYRTGDMYSPKVNQTEALSLATSEFVNAIIEGRKPLTDGDNGLYVIRILEAAEESIKNKGQLVLLS